MLHRLPQLATHDLNTRTWEHGSIFLCLSIRGGKRRKLKNYCFWGNFLHFSGNISSIYCPFYVDNICPKKYFNYNFEQTFRKNVHPPGLQGRPQCSHLVTQDKILQNLLLPVYTSSLFGFWYSYDHHPPCSEVFWWLFFWLFFLLLHLRETFKKVERGVG